MKITITHKSGYSEEGQPNPIRWMILSKNPDGTFNNESSWIRCKDFFNDYAYTYQTGKGFSIWSFNAGGMKVAKKGEPVYMLLDVLTKSFDHNMEQMNKWLVEQDMPEVPCVPYETTKRFITFHPKYFENTYYISLISLIIRLMNVEKEFKTFKEAISWKNFDTKDQQKWDKVVQKNKYFAIPAKLQKYVWYCGEQYNSEKPPGDYQLPSLIHNNGVLNWSEYM